MVTQTQTVEHTTTVDAVAKTSRTHLFAVVVVDQSLNPEALFDPITIQDPIRTEIVKASLYSELQEKLNKPWIIEVQAIIRGRAIPFQETRKMRFF